MRRLLDMETHESRTQVPLPVPAIDRGDPYAAWPAVPLRAEAIARGGGEKVADLLARTIFTALRRMDREAVARADGKATGLWWYGGHARPELRRPSTEVEWSRRLAALLGSSGLAARQEVAYPAQPRERCDLVVEIPGRGRAWLEVKGAWKDYWSARDRDDVFRAYLLHPLVPFPSVRRTHTAALDIAKLVRLRPDDGALAALLVVGFDTADDPLAGDLAELVDRAELDAAPWTGFVDDWTDAAGRGVHVRLWTRSLGKPVLPA